MLQPSLRGADGSYGSSALPDAFKVRTAQLSEGALTTEGTLCASPAVSLACGKGPYCSMHVCFE